MATQAWFPTSTVCITEQCYVFNNPTHPSQLVIIACTKQHLAHILKEQHTECVRVFREMLGVEQALRQQITSTIDPQYIEALQNPTTKRIAAPVYDIICHQFILNKSDLLQQSIIDWNQRLCRFRKLGQTSSYISGTRHTSNSKKSYISIHTKSSKNPLGKVNKNIYF